MRHTNTSNMVKAFALAAVALASVAAVPRISSAAACIQDGVGRILRLNGLPVSKSAAKALQGAYLNYSSDVTVDGSGYVRQDGTRVIGVMEHFNWAGGGWGHPLGNDVFEFPAHSASGTHDLTFLGNGTDPAVGTTGTATIIPCPSSHFQIGTVVGPNRK